MELLAPAGNMNMLKEAIYNGANAVYLGLDQFNARIKADNFTMDNIAEVTRLCHLHGVKVYVVINIAVKDKEIDTLKDYIIACNNANIDAFIVSDIGIVSEFNKYAPHIPLHASTQMAIHNVEGARIVKKLGFSRVVVARETLYSDIKAIKDELNLEVEYFVHGALCVAFSGNCLFSSILSGNSGNRGRCLQPCRQEYSCSLNGKTGYLLSPKDQCLLSKLDDLRDAGVDSLKIEGRLKSRNYVASVVRCYRYTMDNGVIDNNLYNDMLKAYNRGEYTKGYNYDTTNKLMNPKVQGNIGLSIGKIINNGRGFIEVATKYELLPKNGIKILSKDGYELGGMQINEIKRTKSGYMIRSNKNYPIGSEVRITLSDDSETAKSRLNICIAVKETGTALDIQAKYKDIIVNVSRNFEKAQNTASTKDNIIISLSKLTDSEFGLDKIDVQYNDDLFIPKSLLNGLRRELVSNLEEAIIEQYNAHQEKRQYKVYDSIIKNKNKLIHDVTAEIDEKTAITKYLANNANIVINASEFNAKNIQSIINNILIHNSSAEILLKLPSVARGKDMNNIYSVLDTLRGCTGLYADNLYAIDVANKYNYKVMGGYLLNIYNKNNVDALNLTNYLVSAELNSNELNKFDKHAYIFAYGYLGVMTLTHCPLQLTVGSTCDKCKYNGIFYYEDAREPFKIRRIRNMHCIFTLYNSKKHNIIAKCANMDYNYYINFVEDDMAVDDVLKAYIDKDKTFLVDNFTYGHMFRGVK